MKPLLSLALLFTLVGSGSASAAEPFSALLEAGCSGQRDLLQRLTTELFPNGTCSDRYVERLREINRLPYAACSHFIDALALHLTRTFDVVTQANPPHSSRPLVAGSALDVTGLIGGDLGGRLARDWLVKSSGIATKLPLVQFLPAATSMAGLVGADAIRSSQVNFDPCPHPLLVLTLGEKPTAGEKAIRRSELLGDLLLVGGFRWASSLVGGATGYAVLALLLAPAMEPVLEQTRRYRDVAAGAEHLRESTKRFLRAEPGEAARLAYRRFTADADSYWATLYQPVLTEKESLRAELIGGQTNLMRQLLHREWAWHGTKPDVEAYPDVEAGIACIHDPDCRGRFSTLDPFLLPYEEWPQARAVDVAREPLAEAHNVKQGWIVWDPLYEPIRLRKELRAQFAAFSNDEQGEFQRDRWFATERMKSWGDLQQRLRPSVRRLERVSRATLVGPEGDREKEMAHYLRTQIASSDVAIALATYGPRTRDVSLREAIAEGWRRVLGRQFRSGSYPAYVYDFLKAQVAFLRDAEIRKRVEAVAGEAASAQRLTRLRALREICRSEGGMK